MAYKSKGLLEIIGKVNFHTPFLVPKHKQMPRKVLQKPKKEALCRGKLLQQSRLLSFQPYSKGRTGKNSRLSITSMVQMVGLLSSRQQYRLQPHTSHRFFVIQTLNLYANIQRRYLCLKSKKFTPQEVAGMMGILLRTLYGHYAKYIGDGHTEADRTIDIFFSVKLTFRLTLVKR